jgi:hypothetical protein
MKEELVFYKNEFGKTYGGGYLLENVNGSLNMAIPLGLHLSAGLRQMGGGAKIKEGSKIDVIADDLHQKLLELASEKRMNKAKSKKNRIKISKSGTKKNLD